jgi:hypothetical protein
MAATDVMAITKWSITDSPAAMPVGKLGLHMRTIAHTA